MPTLHCHFAALGSATAVNRFLEQGAKYVASYARLILLGVIILLFGGSPLWAQPVFSGIPIDEDQVRPVLPELPDYQLFSLNLIALGREVQAQGSPSALQLVLGDMTLEVQMALLPLVRPTASVTVLTSSGPEVRTPRTPSTYQIRFPQGEGRLLVREGFLAGGFTWEGKDFVLEPLWYYQPDADPSLVVLYERDIARMVAPYRCGSDHPLLASPQGALAVEDDLSEARAAGCKEVEYAYAADWLFFQKYGSESAVMDRIETIMSLVEWQFTNWFNDNYLYPISGYLISACNSCDPVEWTNTNDPFELLTNFRNWGELGGFGNTVYDVAGLWTDRTFNNSIIGIAYLSGVCTDNRYHAIMDFTPNTSLMRVLVAHELGHNFSSDHDAPGSNFIMTPNVNSSTTWSSQSVNAINVFAGNLGCLATCSQNAPPVASFEASPEEGCPPMLVQFTDQSANNPTSWQWTFMGGNPSSSTLQHPQVTYATPGVFSVSLTVTNAGGTHSITVDEVVRVITAPQADFTFQVVQRTVSFYPDAQGATSYQWDFGDGSTSTLQYPQHTYASDGQFLVTLTASNACGDGAVSKSVLIITVPQAGFSGEPLSGCLPLVVVYADESTPNTTQWNWEFPGGTPSVSIEPNPVITYHEPGVFSVSLTASNAAGGNTFTQINYIRVEAPPTAGFVYSQSLDTVFFQVGGGPDSLRWLFGDGQSSSLPNPIHRYAQEGVYEVTLTVWGDCGEDSYSELVTILLPPTADFEAAPPTGCYPLEVHYTQQASPNTTHWQWFFPGGQPAQSAVPDPMVLYAQPGMYPVTLIAINAAGTDTLIRLEAVLVQDHPQAQWSGEVLNGNQVHFTNGSQHALEFFWDFGDGASSQETEPVHIYAVAGEYAVTLVASNACGQDTSISSVIIALPPQAGFSASPVTGCSPLNVQFTDESSQDPVAWDWSFEGGDPAFSDLQNPEINYLLPGDYAVSLTASSANGWGTTLVKAPYIRVITVPTAVFTAVNQQGEVHFFQQAQYGHVFQWQFGDGEVSAEENPRHTYAEEGSYLVTLTVSNPCGVHFTTQVVEVIFPPRAQVDADQRDLCGDTLVVQFQDQSLGQVDQWSWAFEGGYPVSSDEPDPVVTYTQPGNYDVWFSASGPGGADTLWMKGYIRLANQGPKAKFSFLQNGPTIQFFDTSAGAYLWLWDFGDGNTSSETSPVHEFAAAGEYLVRLVVWNPCGTDTVETRIEVLSSRQEVYISDQWVRVFPNPSSSVFNLSLSLDAGQSCSIEVFDMLSRVIYRRDPVMMRDAEIITVDLQEQPKGIYYLRVRLGEETKTMPLVLVR